MATPDWPLQYVAKLLLFASPWYEPEASFLSPNITPQNAVSSALVSCIVSFCSQSGFAPAARIGAISMLIVG
ncbi:hypothetical protein D3C72_1931530 [compost metagenome]